jgi:hypothetical protein
MVVMALPCSTLVDSLQHGSRDEVVVNRALSAASNVERQALLRQAETAGSVNLHRRDQECGAGSLGLLAIGLSSEWNYLRFAICEGHGSVAQIA